jgi:hypothetical protein
MKISYFIVLLASGQCYKSFFGVIYTTSGVFPGKFDQGYADRDVLAQKKVL